MGKVRSMSREGRREMVDRKGFKPNMDSFKCDGF